MDVVSINIQYCGCNKSLKVNIVNNMCLRACDTELILSSICSKWNTINIGEETIWFVRNVCFYFLWQHVIIPCHILQNSEF